MRGASADDCDHWKSDDFDLGPIIIICEKKIKLHEKFQNKNNTAVRTEQQRKKLVRALSNRGIENRIVRTQNEVNYFSFMHTHTAYYTLCALRVHSDHSGHLSALIKLCSISECNLDSTRMSLRPE